MSTLESPTGIHRICSLICLFPKYRVLGWEKLSEEMFVEVKEDISEVKFRSLMLEQFLYALANFIFHRPMTNLSFSLRRLLHLILLERKRRRRRRRCSLRMNLMILWIICLTKQWTWHVCVLSKEMLVFPSFGFCICGYIYILALSFSVVDRAESSSKKNKNKKKKRTVREKVCGFLCY